MATLKYFTKGNRNPSSIYMRLVHGRNVDVTRSTSLLIQSEYWNSKKGRVGLVVDASRYKNFKLVNYQYFWFPNSKQNLSPET